MNRISLSYISCFIWAVVACDTDPKTNKNTDLSDNSSEKVSVLVSTGNRAQNFNKQTVELSENKPNTQATIILNPNQKFQSVYGFGSAITGSTCYNLLKMSAEDRKKFLVETFSTTEGFGQSYVRVPIGCSDFSLSEYTCCDKQGIENFALTEEDTKYLIPILKEIIAINPNVSVIGSPWTPPRWMKVNNLKELKPHNDWRGGHLNPKYYQDYATYFVKWIQAMERNGIDIDAITIQNEPLNRGNSASLFMGWDEQAAFIKSALGKTLHDSGLDVKIYLFDHNFNYDNLPDQKEYPLHIYNDPQAEPYVTGAAYHNYGGHYSELDNIHSKRPDKELIFTETSIGTWNEGRNLERRLVDDMEYLGIGTLNNWCKAVIVWNLMLDENGAPNREHGCKTCFGAVDISSSNYKTLTKNSHYYVINHLSHVIKPKASRIEHQNTANGNILCTSFQNEDGSYALVLLNKGKETTFVSVNDGKKNFGYHVPANSVVSFKWK